MNGTEPKRSEGQRATKPVSYVTGENPPHLRRIKLGAGRKGGGGGGQSEGRTAWTNRRKAIKPHVSQTETGITYCR